eukprot:1630449-Prymnesium_polylepis.1
MTTTPVGSGRAERRQRESARNTCARLRTQAGDRRGRRLDSSTPSLTVCDKALGYPVLGGARVRRVDDKLLGGVLPDRGRLDDEAGHDTCVDFGEPKAPKLTALLHAVEFSNLGVAAEPEDRAGKQVELDGEADAKTTEDAGREQPVREKEAFWLLLHVPEVEHFAANERPETLGGLDRSTRAVIVLDLS